MSPRQLMPPHPALHLVEGIVIGASAGALEALSILLSKLPRDYPLPIFGVVHLPADGKSVLAECLQSKCAIQISEADDKEPIQSGNVYFAPPDYHLMIDSNQRMSLSSEEPVWFSRPSIDVLFESAAEVYGSALIGIILTGASPDGARGLCEIERSGGIALVQRPDSAYASAMPQAALDECPSAIALTLPEIGDYLLEVVAPK